MDIIKKIFKKEYKSLLFVYLLFLIESILYILHPLILGNSIDKFIQHEYKYIFNLILLLGSFIVISYYRRIYDTRIYSTLYRKLILNYIYKQIDKNTRTSTISARSNMLHSIVSFLEVDIPYIFYAIFSIIGSILIIMFNYNFNIGLLVLFSLLPIILISKYYSKKLSVKYNESNNINEKDVDILELKNKTNIKHHYINKNILDVKISNIDAKNNLFNNIVNYSLIIIVLFIFTLYEIPSIGAVMALYQYVNKFTNSALMIPQLVLRFEYLKDVLKRIDT